jgi:hypothetical protein
MRLARLLFRNLEESWKSIEGSVLTRLAISFRYN